MGTHPIFESDFDCLTEMMKGDDQYVPRVTHFPKREVKSDQRKITTTQKIASIGLPSRFQAKPKKRVIVEDEEEVAEKAPEAKKPMKLVTPVRSKIKPLPKITNFRTLEKDTIPERLKMGQCRCVTEFEKLNR